MTPKPSCESARLEALYRYEILDTGSDSGFDDLARLASYICRTPIAAISFLDAERQWFKSTVGLDHKEAPREGAFCAHTILGTDCFIVEKADGDERFKDHPWVVEQPALRFYAGVPLISPDGYAIGSLAVMDPTPRTLSPEQHACLRTLANQVMTQLELRRTARLDNRHGLDHRNDIVTEQKKAEEILRESTHKFRAIFEQAPVGIAMLDSLTGRFKSVNAAYCTIIGYTSEEMLDRTFLDITYPDDLQADLDQMKQLLDGNISTFEMDKRLFRKNGDVIWVHLTCVPLWQRPSDSRMHLAIVQDISERKQAEAALRESEQAIQALHEATAAPGLSFDERIQAVLEVGCRRFGLPIGMLTRAVGERLEFTHVCAPGTGFTAGMDAPLGNTYCNTTLQASNPVCFEHAKVSEWQNHPGYKALGLESYIGTKLIGRDRIYGTICFTGQNPLPTSFTQADKDFVQLMARWISGELDRQEAEQALKQSEERYRTLYDDTPTMYFTLATDGTVRSVNRFGAEQLGYRVEELVGHSVLNVFHEEDKETVAANLSQCLATPETTRHWEFRKVRKDGAVIWVQETVHVGQSSTGEIVVLVTCEDVTERRRAEESLQEMNLALANAMPGISRLDSHGRYLTVNEIYAGALGYDPSDLLGENWTRTVSPGDWPKAKTAYATMMREGKGEFEAVAVRKDGSTFWKQVLLVKIEDQTGRHHGHHCFMRDITKRKQAEEALRKSEQYNRILFENSPIGLVLCQLNGTISDCNERYADILGQDRSAILGKTYWELTPGQYDEQARAVMETLCRAGQFGPYEKEYVHAEGHLVPVRLFGSLIEKDGELFIVCSVEDITDRKQTESRLRATQHAIDHATDYIFVIGSDGYFLDVNESACRRLGYTKEELLTKSVMDIDPDFSRVVWKDFWEEFKRTKLLRLETRHRSKSGEVYPVEVVANYILHEGKELDYAFVRDISERKRAEEALQSSEERFRLVAQATQDLLWDWDLATNTRWWSPNAKDKFGCDLNGMPDDKAWESRLHPDDRDEILALVQGTLSSKLHMFSGKYRFRLADGSYGHFYDRAYIMRDGSGKPTRVIGAMIDVTDIKQAYSSLQEAYHRLQIMANELQTVESNERRRLSRELHDEVGQLLTALKFDLESVRREGGGKKKLPPTQIMERLTRALETTDLLFTRLRQIVRALRPPVLEALGLKASLESLIADVQARTGLICSVVVEGDDHPSGLAPAMETAIYRIAQELLTNVIRHARAKTASVSLAAGPDHWILTVGDDGIGFDPTAQPLTGGIGLRGIRERVEILGGRVDITSQRGQGTLAIVWIPVVVAPVSQAPSKPGRTPSTRRRGRKQVHD